MDEVFGALAGICLFCLCILGFTVVCGLWVHKSYDITKYMKTPYCESVTLGVTTIKKCWKVVEIGNE